jgi:hypothetical protein
MFLAMAAMGTIFGATQTAVTAYANDSGHPGSAGLLYALFGIGSAVAGAACAWLPARFTLRHRYVTFAATLLLGALTLVVGDRLHAVPTAMTIAGVTVAPYLISLYALTERLAPAAETPDAERRRLAEADDSGVPWRRWGPYLSERQWGTVREDYSQGGDAWSYFTHDQARSRAYRWGEDGIAGVSDDKQRLCFALALWNGRDPILKERMFGLTNAEGNHGEDVKEYYFYLDSTPTHSYMKYLYKYPQSEFPYEDLKATNQARGRGDFEYELLDTGIFDEDRYFDVFVEYAKAGPDDLLIEITAHNRGPDEAPCTCCRPCGSGTPGPGPATPPYRPSTRSPAANSAPTTRSWARAGCTATRTRSPVHRERHQQREDLRQFELLPVRQGRHRPLRGRTARPEPSTPTGPAPRPPSTTYSPSPAARAPPSACASPPPNCPTGPATSTPS